MKYHLYKLLLTLVVQPMSLFKEKQPTCD